MNFIFVKICDVELSINRWEVEGTEEGIQYGPFPVPKKGFPIKVTLKNKEENSKL